MKSITISHPSGQIDGSCIITGSKSETNRLLILQAQYPSINLENISNSEDSQVMQKALSSFSDVVDIHHAGTAMRFLTAFLATKPGFNGQLTGSKRMQERPIGLLVEALQSLGAKISYVNNEGYPPLQINGSTFTKQEVSLPAHMSSQYISALMLIGAQQPQGLTIHLKGKITSLPYIQMTLQLLEHVGIQAKMEGPKIHIMPHTSLEASTQVIESDWSSASYFYSMTALAQEGKVQISSYREDSLQGDSCLKEIYAQLGIHSSLANHQLQLTKLPDFQLPDRLELDLVASPDIAQTIAVTCFGLGISCDLKGLHTLKIKETDRLVALQNELGKLGANVEITDDRLFLHPRKAQWNPELTIDTYNDHRMAMAFAPLALIAPLGINDPDVVQKSYPDFWTDLSSLNFKIIKV